MGRQHPKLIIMLHPGVFLGLLIALSLSVACQASLRDLKLKRLRSGGLEYLSGRGEQYGHPQYAGPGLEIQTMGNGDHGYYPGCPGGVHQEENEDPNHFANRWKSFSGQQYNDEGMFHHTPAPHAKEQSPHHPQLPPMMCPYQNEQFQQHLAYNEHQQDNQQQRTNIPSFEASVNDHITTPPQEQQYQYPNHDMKNDMFNKYEGGQQEQQSPSQQYPEHEQRWSSNLVPQSHERYSVESQQETANAQGRLYHRDNHLIPPASHKLSHHWRSPLPVEEESMEGLRPEYPPTPTPLQQHLKLLKKIRESKKKIPTSKSPKLVDLLPHRSTPREQNLIKYVPAAGQVASAWDAFADQTEAEAEYHRPAPTTPKPFSHSFFHDFMPKYVETVPPATCPASPSYQPPESQVRKYPESEREDEEDDTPTRRTYGTRPTEQENVKRPYY